MGTWSILRISRRSMRMCVSIDHYCGGVSRGCGHDADDEKRGTDKPRPSWWRDTGCSFSERGDPWVVKRPGFRIVGTGEVGEHLQGRDHVDEVPGNRGRTAALQPAFSHGSVLVMQSLPNVASGRCQSRLLMTGPSQARPARGTGAGQSSDRELLPRSGCRRRCK